MADQTAYQKEIRKISIFKYLSESELKKITEVSEILLYKPQDKIVSEGDLSPYLFAILRGGVNVCVDMVDTKNLFISTIGEGEVFGEAGIFMNVKRTANVVCNDQTVILRIHRDQLLRFIKEEPSGGIKILMLIIHSLLRKLREANQEIAFERKTYIGQDDVDSIVDQFMKS